MKIQLDLSQTRPKTCTKCHKGRDVFRHHMGNDAQLGVHNKWIKDNYTRYLDCVYLCNRCHMIIHWIYLPVVQVWSDWTSKGVLELRTNLIKLCRMWLDGKIDNPHVPRAFRQSWQRNFLQWRSQNRLSKNQPARTRGK